MIDLTPLEVRKKKGDFRKAMRGYEPQAVDDFIDLVADRLEQLVRDNAALNERVRSTETQVSDYRERERALTEALVTAQEMREEMRRQMEREVEIKMREAEADVDAMRSAAEQKREREEENVRRLRARQTQFVQSYRAFLERELAEIGVMAQTLDLTDDAPAAPTRKRPRKAENPAQTEVLGLPPVAPVIVPVVDVEPKVEDIVPPPDEDEAGDEMMGLLDFEEEEEEEKEEIEPVRVTEPESEIPTHDTLIDLDSIFPPEPTEELPDPVGPAPAAAKQMDLSDVPFDEQEIPELELIDEVTDEADVEEEEKKDPDADGWVSTLLEGKGD